MSGIDETDTVVLYTNVKFTSLWIIMKIVQKFVAAIWKKLATNILKASIYSLLKKIVTGFFQVLLKEH